ncbi:MAG: endonuclease/exonuclease/phosphatase family protein [Gammaproteobacteria bacterium]
MLFSTLAGFTLLLTVLTFLPLWRHEAWWVRGGDFPRLQFAFAALILLAVAAFALELSRPESWVVITASLVCLLYQSWWILPYTPLYSNEVKPAAHADRDNTLRFMVANVLTPNRNAGALLTIVETNRPDVLIAVETDEWWQAQLDVLERDYPHALKCPQENFYGMHLYSRLPLEDAEIQFLVQDDVPSMHTIVITIQQLA